MKNIRAEAPFKKSLSDPNDTLLSYHQIHVIFFLREITKYLQGQREENLNQTPVKGDIEMQKKNKCLFL